MPQMVPFVATAPGALFLARRQVSPPSSFSLSALRAELLLSERRGLRGQRQRHFWPGSGHTVVESRGWSLGSSRARVSEPSAVGRDRPSCDMCADLARARLKRTYAVPVDKAWIKRG